MKYQGAMSREMVPVFGTNNKDDVIKLIRNNPDIMLHESQDAVSRIFRDM